MRSIFLAAALATIGGSANAQMPPSYDIVGWCRDDVATGGFPEDGIARCVAVEQRKARALRSNYWSVPESIRDQCESATAGLTQGRGSYAVLGYCLETNRVH